jgi:hypothetical protein
MSYLIAPFNRRDFCGAVAKSLPAVMLACGTGSFGATAGRPKRFVLFFLAGGWDSALCTDPLVGAKAESETYEPVYRTLPVHPVPGKDRLVVGHGLGAAARAFAAIDTAFVNGMVTYDLAHQTGIRYVISGKPVRSRTLEYPAFSVLIGNGSGRFPGHLILGYPVPLGDLQYADPPLQMNGVTEVKAMLAGYPKLGTPAADKAASDLIAAMDRRLAARLLPAQAEELARWGRVSGEAGRLYEAGFGKKSYSRRASSAATAS